MKRLTLALGLPLALAFVAGVPALPAQAGTGMTVKVVQPTLYVGDTATISGTVGEADGDPAGEAVTVTRTDSAGSDQPACMTTLDGGGNYSCDDSQPVIRGDVTYTATWVGDVITPTDSAQVTVHVFRHPTVLHLDLARRVVTAGHSATVTATLASPTTSRTVTIYAKPYHRTRREVAHGDVDGSGQLVAHVPVKRRTAFTAVFGGDDAYAAATAKAVQRVRADLNERLRRSYGTSSGVALYRHDVNPALFAELIPAHDGSCVHFRAQRRSHGYWETVDTSPCVRTTSDGLVLGVLTGHHAVGRTYRLRAEWRGSTAVLARNGAWLRLRFTR